jgi:uncharacterized HAD superfamily protein
MFYAGYGDMWAVIQDMAMRMPDVDAIAGVPISGLAPAGMLSAATGVKCVPIESVPDGIKKILVLEDASGYAKMRDQRLGQADGRRVLYGAVYACDAALSLDFIGAVAPKPRIFTWNITKSDNCKRIAFDLDGVLCRDPLPHEIDYGPKYAAFIETADPLRVVKSYLGWIVTGRMERYRDQTEAWLLKHGIRYRELIMAPDNQTHTMEAHAKHKAAFLASHPDCLLFVESSPNQAARIAELSNRAVVCSQTEEHWNTDAASKPACTFAKRHDRIIYTISTGEYERVQSATICPPDGWDFRRITSADCPPYLSPKQQAAWAKINGTRIFAEYSESLCIDDDMKVTGDPASLFACAEMTTLTRERNATWKTDLALVEGERMAASSASVQAEIARLSRAGFADSANYMTGIVHRRHTETVCALCDEWWYWYGQSETQRDQPSLAVACQKLAYAPAVITEGRAAEAIVHDSRKATREKTRATVPAIPKSKNKHNPKRRGDKT